MKTITFDETKFQLVPKVPTPQMLEEGCKAGLDLTCLLDDTRFSTEIAIYGAMLKHAPEGI